MLKKLFMILCGVLIATDSFATTDIAANAESSTCDSGVLGATEGDVNFDAKWAANNVKLIWHDNHTIIQTAQNTCSYDGTLTIPATEPQRVGYTFGGWHVMPTINASTLTSLSTGTERWAKGWYHNAIIGWHTTGTGSIPDYGYDDAKGAGYGDLELNEWKVSYTSGTTKGTLYGTGYCSGKSGTNSSGKWNTSSSFSTYADLESASGEKKYCWCQATGWKAEGSSTLQALSSLSSNQPWVFGHNPSSADDCATNCAARCARSALANSAFRRALFVGAEN